MFSKVFMPIKELIVGFAVTGAIFYSIPVSAETRANSKYYNGSSHDDHH